MPSLEPSVIKRLTTHDPDFTQQLAALLAFENAQDEGIEQAVAEILTAVRTVGDAAVLEYTRRFDHLDAKAMIELELPKRELEAALFNLPADQREALEQAATRIALYHQKQLAASWEYTEADGTRLGQKVTPLDRVGLYVPGGKAAYPSSVLMNAIPAKVAGVGELIMVVPTPRGEKNALVLAAAALAGVDRVFTIADGSTDADWVAMDLFAQAEHDELAQSILLCPDGRFIEAVEKSMARLLPEMPRKEVISASLAGRGALIHVRDLEEACTIANLVSPEHLELSVADPNALVDRIRHAGAIFIGRYTSESLGDYCAGPNHVLPTSRSARFSSPLGVYDFQKRTSIIEVSADGADKLGRIASTLAHGEGLQAHARAAELRLKSGK